MSRATIVPSLRIHAASGTTLYPAENGYSAVWGEVESDHVTLTSVLDQVAQVGAPVALRCGLLEVTGTL
jgi:hypothetical protein